MSNQYERILKLRRRRELQKTLRANQLLEQVKAAEAIVEKNAVTDESSKQAEVRCEATVSPLDYKD